MSNQLLIDFDQSVEDSKKEKWARELSTDLSDFGAERLRSNTDTMDFGATLSLTIGTAGVVAFCRMIESFIQKNRTSITIKSAKGDEIKIDAASGSDAIEIAEKIKPLVEAQK